LPAARPVLRQDWWLFGDNLPSAMQYPSGFSRDALQSNVYYHMVSFPNHVHCSGIHLVMWITEYFTTNYC